ncbi:MAG TPA: hypothetical protein VFQ13_18350 [Anaerolineales bacterium]|nr:hypothetical protein [Anaerolineales bacterium]
MTARKETQITVELSLASTLRTAEEILLKRIGATIKSIENNTIFAKKGMSFRSWGEDITISVSPRSATSSVLKITSESSLKTTLLDWGANSINVKEIVQAFQSVNVDAVHSG